MVLGLKAAFAVLLNHIAGTIPSPVPNHGSFFGFDIPLNWMYPFVGWDSVYYHAIAANWYPHELAPLWAYFPLYPATIRMLGLLGLDLWICGFIISVGAGCISILIFQKIAEVYLDKKTSLVTTALYFLLPPVFIFTTVSYTESLFLLLSLVAWWAHIKGKTFASVVSASFLVLSCGFGILILFPLAYDLIRRRQFEKVPLLGLPIATLLCWLGYAYVETGNALTPYVVQSYWNTERVIEIRLGIILFITHGDLKIVELIRPYELLLAVGAFFIVLITFLTFRTWKIDSSLGVYSSTFLLFTGAIAVTLLQNYVSLARYLSIIFPVGMALQIRDKSILYLALSLLICSDLVAWWMFIFTNSFH